ncbi:MAG: hypothetical protein GXO29_04625 [Thermotogae bacterium]|nr:hypothetical protein [Thermotogota bacterium]
MRISLLTLLVLLASCSKVEVDKAARYDAALAGVPKYPEAEVVGLISAESPNSKVISYVLRTRDPYDSVVAFYLGRADGTDSAAAGQIYTIRRGNELLIQIKEEGQYREVRITRALGQ